MAQPQQHQAPRQPKLRFQSRRRAVWGIVFRRVAVAIPILVATTAGVFALAAVSPFDPLDAYLKGQAGNFTEAQRESIAHQLGLDRTWWESWLVPFLPLVPPHQQPRRHAAPAHLKQEWKNRVQSGF